ncbi:hypothetical protein JCM9279_000083 [Rhodotorula babjevae]
MRLAVLFAAASSLVAAFPLDVGNSSATSALSTQLSKRATVTADGTSLQSGTLFDSVDWQASGVLLEGCDISTGISECHTLALAPSGQLARRSEPEPVLVERDNVLVARAAPRQRIEFLSRPNSRTGETWTYSWSYGLAPGVSTSDHFLHLVQLFSRTTGGFLFALDALDLGAGPVVRIVDSDQGRCATARGDCPTLPLSRFAGRTMRHVLRVRWGVQGFLDYSIRDLRTNARLLTYSRSSTNLPDNGYVKTGLYRAIIDGATSATAYVGDFAFVRE